MDLELVDFERTGDEEKSVVAMLSLKIRLAIFPSGAVRYLASSESQFRHVWGESCDPKRSEEESNCWIN